MTIGRKSMKKFLKYLTIASAAVVAILTVSSPAQAVLLNWNLDGVTYDDGGIASGSFQYDADTEQIGNIDISVTNGTTFSSFNYQFTGLVSGDFGDGFSLRDFNANNRWFQLAFNQLSNAGGSVSVVGNSYEATCINVSCSNPAFPIRNVTAGEIVGTPATQPVPEPLTIMGTFLAGGMGVAIKKKRAKKNLKSGI